MSLYVKILFWHLANSKKASDRSLSTFVRSIMIKLFYKKTIFPHYNASLLGIQNIFSKKTLHVGTVAHELSHRNDSTLLDIRGRMFIDSEFYHIGRGCRIDVAENTELKIGKGGFINPFTNIIVRNGVTIGNDTYISWNCQILDEDYHEVSYDGRTEKDKKIEIGNHVWMGTGVSIYQGTKIADGCVVAANSVVRGISKRKTASSAGIPQKSSKKISAGNNGKQTRHHYSVL
ncbi:acyltransferase [Chryseobacterium taklimakanense]|uniref:acyltransferase n=1 Tax=Chryseobacterium taklimakanense TaxID=536441 RepID=UPI001EF5209C|nr:acyltransferase [Chryseobacterium taklimakanense]MCG7281480.1 acyltransferase [Chryseobacterium taklimakanense]